MKYPEIGRASFRQVGMDEVDNIGKICRDTGEGWGHR